MSNIDFGNAPVGSIPTSGERQQMRDILEVGGLDTPNNWSEQQTFNSLLLGSGIPSSAGSLMYCPLEGGEVKAFPIGSNLQTLTVESGVLVWKDVSNQNWWRYLGEVIHDGTNLISNPLFLPQIDANTEAIEIFATSNSETNLFYISFEISDGQTVCEITSQNFSNSGLSLDGTGGYPTLNGRDEFNKIRSGDTWSYYYKVSDAYLYDYSINEPFIFAGSPFTPEIFSACNISLKYRIIARP